MRNFKIYKKKRRALYKNIESVFCPILGSTVFFTSEGFNHLIYESNRKPRKIGEQFMKLQCLSEAPNVIADCKVISDTRQLRRKIKGKYKTVVRYALVHEVKKGIKMRVIVERVGDGTFKFLSVMPHDRTSKINNAKEYKLKKRP